MPVNHESNALTRIPMKLNKSFCGGSRGTYSAVLRNTHGDDTSFEASYAVLALQMLPHAVGFSRKEPPWPPEAYFHTRQQKFHFRYG
ncbi:MAG: hypothetical protein GTO45_19495 [Candidatus Aminicenantes bacterium]|nr:hypothetical protein [Candidatus Aminicenantes bacterium]NIN20355.1 hypothetical protein [Candidatus Aminicenantes bacterium]NIN40784.1 hypothetical protein [Candidatus Aminicenantes bacterium]NIN86946.1 hypothetical protein [Candidatus Aminicenantes bacterium]NIO79483.1 hypothetical protein [Candidatus Aminicenantes bacterium]